MQWPHFLSSFVSDFLLPASISLSLSLSLSPSPLASACAMGLAKA